RHVRHTRSEGSRCLTRTRMAALAAFDAARTTTRRRPCPARGGTPPASIRAAGWEPARFYRRPRPPAKAGPTSSPSSRRLRSTPRIVTSPCRRFGPPLARPIAHPRPSHPQRAPASLGARPGPDLGRAEPRCTTSQRTDRRMVLRRAPGFLLTICTAIRRTRAACSRSPRPTLGRYPDSPKLANPKKGTRRPTSSILPIEDSSRILVTWSAGWNASSGSTPHPTPPPTFGPVRKPEVVPERDPAPVSFALLVATIPAAPSPAILAKLAALLGLALVALVLLP